MASRRLGTPPHDAAFIGSTFVFWRVRISSELSKNTPNSALLETEFPDTKNIALLLLSGEWDFIFSVPRSRRPAVFPGIRLAISGRFLRRIRESHVPGGHCSSERSLEVHQDAAV